MYIWKQHTIIFVEQHKYRHSNSIQHFGTFKQIAIHDSDLHVNTHTHSHGLYHVKIKQFVKYNWEETLITTKNH